MKKNKSTAHFKALLIVTVLFSLIYFISKVLFLDDKSIDQNSITKINLMETKGLPQITGELISGEKFNSSKLTNKIVIVNFWASWCSPCIEEFPSLIKLTQEFPNDIYLVAISEDTSTDDINAFLKSFPNLKSDSVSVIFDKNNQLMKEFGINKLPESLIANKEYKLVKKIVGSINWYTPDSKEYIKSLLAPAVNK